LIVANLIHFADTRSQSLKLSKITHSQFWVGTHRLS